MASFNHFANSLVIWKDISINTVFEAIKKFLLDTGSKMNVDKTFNLHPVSRGLEVMKSGKQQNNTLP